MTAKVFLVDDHEIVRRGLRELIDAEDDLEVVGEASNADEAIKRVPAAKPTVAVLDVRLPDMSGVELCRELRDQHDDLKCLMLTSFSDDEALFSAIVAGASGYVLKEVRGTELLDDIRRVNNGESLLDPKVTAQVFERLRNEDKQRDKLSDLSPQEQKILNYIGEGLTNREIAHEMFLAEKTVKNYVSNLLAKLGMSRRTEAAVYVTKLKTGQPDT